MKQFRKLKMYIVMNDEGMLQQCMETLRNFEDISLLGFSVDPEEGRRRVQQLVPDLLLTEMFMPRLDGITLALQCQEKMGQSAPYLMFCYRFLPETVYLLQRTKLLSVHMFPVANEVLELQFRQAFICCRSMGKNKSIDVDQQIRAEHFGVESYRTISSSAEERMEYIVSYELSRLGFLHKYLGYQYLQTAIVHILCGKESVQHMMQLYQNVGKLYATSPQNVEKNIRVVIAAAWKNGNEKVWGSLYHKDASYAGKTPSNGSFLHQIEQQIKRDYFW